MVEIEPFSSLDASLIWYLNGLFWKHFELWQATYGEHYEASLPSGVSESHREPFVRKSADTFIALLENLDKNGELPETVYVLEQGPGSGLYAKIFLDALKAYSKKNNRPFYDQTHYLLADTSQAILAASLTNLTAHESHVQTTTSLAKYAGKILFARHSNLWDQLPARIFSSQNGQLSELDVQPVLDENLSAHLKKIGSQLTLQDITKALKNRTVETLIVNEPQIWKPLVRALFLKTRVRAVTESDFKKISHHETVRQLAGSFEAKECVFNGAALSNIEELSLVIDWPRGGYIEVLDIVVPEAEGFDKDRRPKKYDGSLGVVVNGPMLKAFGRQINKHVSFEKIRGLNHTVTIRERSLKNLLQSNHFVTIAEIAASKTMTAEEIIAKADNLLEHDIDVVAFSDQALVKSEYFKLAELAKLDLFTQLPTGAVLPILKARTKTESEVATLSRDLRAQDIQNLFVVTGDPSGEDPHALQTSLDVLPHVSHDFFAGAVAHPQASDIPKLRSKIKAGAQFAIMQATYDRAEWRDWAEAIKNHGLHNKIPLVAVVMPIVSLRTLEVVQAIKDVSVPASFVGEFNNLSSDDVRHKGMELAKTTISEYKTSGIFSGIYIYSRSVETILELNKFTRDLG